MNTYYSTKTKEKSLHGGEFVFLQDNDPRHLTRVHWMCCCGEESLALRFRITHCHVVLQHARLLFRRAGPSKFWEHTLVPSSWHDRNGAARVLQRLKHMSDQRQRRQVGLRGRRRHRADAVVTATLVASIP